MAGAGTMSRHLHLFSAQDELSATLSQNIARELQQAIDKRGRASLIVSGGNTPKPLFEKLSQIEIAWEKVTVGLCDERWLEPSDDDSNEKLVKTHLLQNRASKARFVGMYTQAKSAKEAEEECSQRIREQLFPFDVLLLGMGNDGHIASLFPDNEKLEEAFDLERKTLCVAIAPDSAPHMRMSLTLGAIVSAEHLYLHFEGVEKLALYYEAIEENDRHKMPVCAVLHQEIKDVEVYCYE
jgi:6-phosphogluconolactonase